MIKIAETICEIVYEDSSNRKCTLSWDSSKPNGTPRKLCDITRLVKAADKISAYIKCLEELKMGNREFAVAAEATKSAIAALGCRAADIFMEEFIPSFNLSLDEQN